MKQFFLTFLAAALVSWGAQAQEPSADCPSRPKNDKSAKTLAGTWFNKGAKLVDEEHYQEALEAFSCSLKMVEHPDTVFNAAQAARVSEDHRVALKLLRRYLELAPFGNMSAEAEAFIPELQRIIAEKEQEQEQEERLAEDNDEEEPLAEEEQALTTTEAEGPVVEDDLETKAKDRPKLKTAGWISIGVGGVLLVGSAVLQGLAAKAVSDGEETDDYKGEWNDLDKKRKGYQTGAIIGFIGGGIAAGLGLTFLIIDSKSEDSPEVSLLPSPNGISIAGKF